MYTYKLVHRRLGLTRHLEGDLDLRERESLAARYLEKKTRRFFDFFHAPPFLFPRVHPRLTR